MSGGDHLRGDLPSGDEPTAPLRRPGTGPSQPGPTHPGPHPASQQPGPPHPAPQPGSPHPGPQPAPPQPGPPRVGPLPPPIPPPGPPEPSSPAPPPAVHERGGVRGWLEVHGALLLVLLIALGGMVQVLTEHWRQGSALLGGSLLVAALLRGVLPPARAGLLAIRGRVVDVVCYTVFGIAVLLLALTITRGSLTVG
ncbi:hypothetical protein GCM10010472_52980 [Pseudonocardia halophobica]|uniref:DUF3017 domain-containing protein n=1 Tax=Pseudonocardia halophobica TaxID=29401 RepID=A0A9W6L386_9PSEU|nr:DUF3017 domain-containing protein [Pseudonocardia halophobica]GLL11434.1 hypothetical protein GCM10017577_25750 [Pseudonocardia halophobica]